jgi:hypothetical protein
MPRVWWVTTYFSDSDLAIYIASGSLGVGELKKIEGCEDDAQNQYGSHCWRFLQKTRAQRPLFLSTSFSCLLTFFLSALKRYNFFLVRGTPSTSLFSFLAFIIISIRICSLRCITDGAMLYHVQLQLHIFVVDLQCLQVMKQRTEVVIVLCAFPKKKERKYVS